MPVIRSKTRVSLLLALLALGVSVGAALVRKVPTTRPDQVVEVAPGVYFRQGDLEGKAHCNNGFVIFKDFIVVIDANFPSGAEACLEDIRKLSKKPVRFVFDTHHHGDHAYGNPVWTASGAIPVAHEKVIQEIERYEPQRWQEASQEREDIRKLGLSSPQPPIVTYPDRMVIDDGTQRVELLHFGTAHTQGDGFAYLPQHKALFTGDAVVNGPYNYMGDGDTHSWIKAIAELQKLDIEMVLPGHGSPSNSTLLARQKAFIVALHTQVEQGIKVGRSLQQLQDSITLPDSVGLHVGEKLQEQIEKVFSEKTK